MYQDFFESIPLLILSATTLGVLLLAAFRSSGRTVIAVAIIAMLVAGLYAALDMFMPGSLPVFGSLLHASGVASAFIAAFSFGGVIALLLSAEYLAGVNEHVSEYVMLVLASVVGMTLIAMASDFTILFLGLEL